MSYNLVNPTTGALTRVAGRGKAEYGASSVRSGTYKLSSSVQVQEDLSFSVTFSEPMPDNDYQVIFGSSSNDTASGTMQCVVRSRSTTGFSGVIRNVGMIEISAASGTFTVKCLIRALRFFFSLPFLFLQLLISPSTAS